MIMDKSMIILCFSGEDLENLFIIAKDKVECLTVPRVHFIRGGRSRFLDKLCMDLNNALPTNELAFKQYKSLMQWEKYKCQTIQDVLTQKHRDIAAKFSEMPNVMKGASWRAEDMWVRY